MGKTLIIVEKPSLAKNIVAAIPDKLHGSKDRRGEIPAITKTTNI